MNSTHETDKVTLNMMNAHTWKSSLRRMTLALALSLALPAAMAAADQRTFPTPEAAVDALKSALKSNDEAALVALVGAKHRSLVATGDSAGDAQARAKFAAAIASFLAFDERGADKRVLLVGTQAYPLAIPLVREGGVWRFAGEQGAEEIINRRVGRNERNAIRVLRTFVDAQRQYASVDRDRDGVRQYARKLSSSAGKQDGLYWPADATKGDELSPFGPLIAESSIDPATRKKGDAYNGYHFRILSAQGKSAPGGAYSYLINGRMIAGFAMVAYPHEYDTSGVMTFIVNHNGKVYQKDLGKGTEGIASKMTAFDPGAGWTAVED